MYPWKRHLTANLVLYFLPCKMHWNTRHTFIWQGILKKKTIKTPSNHWGVRCKVFWGTFYMKKNCILYGRKYSLHHTRDTQWCGCCIFFWDHKQFAIREIITNLWTVNMEKLYHSIWCRYSVGWNCRPSWWLYDREEKMHVEWLYLVLSLVLTCLHILCSVYWEKCNI